MNRLQFLLFLSLVLALGCDSTETRGPATVTRDIGTVQLTVDFGQQKTPLVTDVVCSEDSTVLSITERAHNMNELSLVFRGTGERAFVESIDSLKNEGGGGNNWIYRVNDETGSKGAGVFEVDPGDKISWSYGQLPDELLAP